MFQCTAVQVSWVGGGRALQCGFMTRHPPLSYNCNEKCNILLKHTLVSHNCNRTHFFAHRHSSLISYNCNRKAGKNLCSFQETVSHNLKKNRPHNSVFCTICEGHQIKCVGEACLNVPTFPFSIHPPHSLF